MSGCTNNIENNDYNTNTTSYFTRNSKVYDVIENVSFSGFVNLIFPVDRPMNWTPKVGKFINSF